MLSSVLVLFMFPFVSQASIWCYSCVSTQPGCRDDGVNWLLHSAITCPKEDDKCVKIIEEKGGEKLITRDCLSNLIGVKSNIPGDTFEGCRPASSQPNLGVYVDNSDSKVYDLKRDYWTRTTYCFCQLDHWCNSSTSLMPNLLVAIFSIAIGIFLIGHQQH
ncbi:QVR superfamily protein crim [Brevipalpus obovatus]|uniref:QVR superfamily protein crim n=1 Tax=Brevipalpus obovatus TaxID=246614 RepID=UPI003D9E3B89